MCPGQAVRMTVEAVNDIAVPVAYITVSVVWFSRETDYVQRAEFKDDVLKLAIS